MDKDEVIADVAELKVQMQVALEGVSNFREHSKRATTFFDKAEERWTNDEKRRNRNLTIGGILAVVLTPAFCYVGTKTLNLISEMLQIEQEWRAAHPSEFKEHSFFDPSSPVYAKDKPQVSTIPTLR